MPVDPDAFDVPVVDYDFSKATTPGRSLNKWLAGALRPRLQRLAPSSACVRPSMLLTATLRIVTNWLSFPACLCATGTAFVEAVKRKMFNAVSTTWGSLDHDIARAQAYYHGSFDLDDVELGEHALMRLGNVIVLNASTAKSLKPLSCPFSKTSTPPVEGDQQTGADAWIGFGSIHLVELKQAHRPRHLHHWQTPNPGLYSRHHGRLHRCTALHVPTAASDFHLDTCGRATMSDFLGREPSNALMVGGGISKHQYLWNQYRGGLTVRPTSPRPPSTTEAPRCSLPRSHFVGKDAS